MRSIVGPDRMEGCLRTVPVGRLGDPDFIARTGAPLAAPEAASVTGACRDAAVTTRADNEEGGELGLTDIGRDSPCARASRR